MITQARADAARVRDELRELLDDRARVLTEARDGERSRAERDLDAARAELAGMRQEPGQAQAGPGQADGAGEAASSQANRDSAPAEQDTRPGRAPGGCFMHGALLAVRIVLEDLGLICLIVVEPGGRGCGVFPVRPGDPGHQVRGLVRVSHDVLQAAYVSPMARSSAARPTGSAGGVGSGGRGAREPGPRTITATRSRKASQAGWSARYGNAGDTRCSANAVKIAPAAPRASASSPSQVSQSPSAQAANARAVSVADSLASEPGNGGRAPYQPGAAGPQEIARLTLSGARYPGRSVPTIRSITPDGLAGQRQARGRCGYWLITWSRTACASAARRRCCSCLSRAIWWRACTSAA